MSSPRGRAPVYQIDFMAVASGKRIASTKRRVRWRFGFANTEALAAGETGTNCRGEEHDVTLVWSLTSGKRMIIADGQEVHYSNSRNNIFDFSWTMKGNNILKIVAHASPPLSPTPGFRQYDFFVNGQSFFSFPKVFRLGLSPNDPRGGSPSGTPRVAESSQRYNRAASGSIHGIASIEAPGNPDEEEAYLQEAIRQSLEDDAKEAAEGKASSSATGDLLDFGAPPPAAAPANNAFAGALVPAPSSGYAGASNPFAAPGNPYGAPPATAANSYGAPPQQNNPYGVPQPSQQQVVNPYGAPATSNGVAFAKPPADPSHNPYGQPQPHAGNPYGTSQPSVASSNPYASAPAASNPYAPPVPAATSNPYAAHGQNSTSSYAPAQAASNPYAPAPSASNPSAPTPSNPYAPDGNNIFGVPAPAANPYGTAPAPTNPYGSAPAPENNPYGLNGGAPEQQKNVFEAPVAPENGFASNPYVTPGVDVKSTGQQMNGGMPQDLSTPRGEQTPSSLGFGSPAADFSGFSPFGDQKPAEVAGSKADQAYYKLANLDTFSLASKKDEERSNPFESGSITETKSLADIAKSKPKPTKEIMKSHAMVVSNNQSNYASQYGVGQNPQMSQSNSMGQPQQQYGQAQPQYGQPQQSFGQQPQYGQSMSQGKPSQNQYGQGQPPQNQFGHGQPPQNQYGHPPPNPQQPQYGQPAPNYGQPQAMGQPQNSYGQPQAFNQPPQMGAPQYGQPQQQFGNQGYR